MNFPRNNRVDGARRRTGFTLIEVLVVVAIIALLIAALLPSLHRAREVSKRTVCVSDLHQMSLGWTIYHADNKGGLMNAGASGGEGTVGPPPTPPAAGYLDNHAPAYLKFISTNPYAWTDFQQTESIRRGALYKYIRSLEVYHCPGAARKELITYGESISMSQDYDNADPGNPFRGAFLDGCFTRRIDGIKKPALRFVYLDSFAYDWDWLWAIWYDQPLIWNLVPGRHTKGTVMSFADGHAEYWRWHTAKMLRAAGETAEQCDQTVGSMKGDPDFFKIYKGVWERPGAHAYGPPW